MSNEEAATRHIFEPKAKPEANSMRTTARIPPPSLITSELNQIRSSEAPYQLVGQTSAQQLANALPPEATFKVSSVRSRRAISCIPLDVNAAIWEPNPEVSSGRSRKAIISISLDVKASILGAKRRNSVATYQLPAASFNLRRIQWNQRLTFDTSIRGLMDKVLCGCP